MEPVPTTDNISTDVFIYRALKHDEQEIRVVGLALSSTSSDSPIELRIEHIKLQDSPKYWALSYTWDAPFEGLPPEWNDPNATRTIYVDGLPFEIRWNLEAALRHMRDANMFKLPFWIDAICINQPDTLERNQQVQMMGEIYANALGTWVWLGPEREDRLGAKEAINKSLEAADAHPGCFANSTFTYDKATYARMDLLDGPTHHEIRAFARLLDRSWFQRAWIVQEVALSKTVVLIWGDKTREVTKWQWLNRTGFLLQQYLYSFESLEGDLEPARRLVFEALLSLKKGRANIQRIDSLRHSVARGHRFDLSWVLEHVRQFHASEPRDKVYAALGMAANGDIVRVNYNLSESDVYLNATRAILESTHDLAVLGHCCPSSKTSLPSWVPDFAISNPAPALKTSLLIKDMKEDRHRSWRLYTAGTSQPPTIRFENEATLVLRGVFIGVLSFVGCRTARESLWKDFDSLQDVGDWKETRECQQHVGEIHGFEALQSGWFEEWKNQTRGKEPPPPEQYKWTQEDNWTAFIRTLCGDYDWGGPHQMPKRLEKDFTFTNESLLALRKRSLPETLVSQVFAATRIHSFCLVREDAEVGDFVFVANGADSPYLLRPTGTGSYRFMGYCYVHGFMAGEARKTWPSRTGGSVTLTEMEAKIV